MKTEKEGGQYYFLADILRLYGIDFIPEYPKDIKKAMVQGWVRADKIWELAEYIESYVNKDNKAKYKINLSLVTSIFIEGKNYFDFSEVKSYCILNNIPIKPIKYVSPQYIYKKEGKRKTFVSVEGLKEVIKSIEFE